MMFDEPPLPLFSFPNNEKWVIGAFTRLDEMGDLAIFFYTYMKKIPSSGFIKYSNNNIEKTEITNRINEHGYLYGKIIRLTSKHPLVDI